MRSCAKFLLWALLVLNWGVSALQLPAESEKPLVRTRRIINGTTTDNTKFPYAVSIQAKLTSGLKFLVFGGVEHFCGGTLVHPRWILTAAHCLFAYTDDEKLMPLLDVKAWHVRLGTSKLRPSIWDRMKGYMHRAYNSFFGYSKHQPFYHIEKIIIHPDYTEGFLENDIALMKLKERILIRSMHGVEVAELPDISVTGEDWPKAGQECSAVGWGCACAQCPPQMNLLSIKMPIVDPKVCRQMYRAPINLTETKEFCSGFFKKNSGICPGDSGGPLVCQFNGRPMLAGVVSATHAKRPESYPAVFSRVIHFTQWIRDTIQANASPLKRQTPPSLPPPHNGLT